MKYFKFNWDESLGGKLDSWGTSEWYMEIDPDGILIDKFRSFNMGQS